MEAKLEQFLTKVENVVSKWLEEFESHPIQAGIKVVVILYLVRFARRNLL